MKDGALPTFGLGASEADDLAHASNSDPVQRAAMEWQVTLWSGEVTPQERQRFERWLAADAAHARAWQRVQGVSQQLRAVPATIARPALRAASPPPMHTGRRNLLRGLAVLVGGGASAYAVRQTPQWQAATADYSTARGQRQDVTLPDGTRLTLNTSTAVDLRFTGTERRVVLRRGEVLIATAPDTAPVHRPFVVETRQGDIRALGTRFTVRHLDDASPAEVLVQVFEGAVEITPREGGGPVRINAGQQSRFSSSGAQPANAADPMAEAWSRGLLVAERQRLADLLAELGRYRSGVLRCDPAVADLPVSGVFPLHDTDAILQSLVQALPIRVRMTTRYWVTVTTPDG